MRARFEVRWVREFRNGSFQLFLSPFAPEYGTEGEEPTQVDEVLFEIALEAVPNDFEFADMKDSGEIWGERTDGIIVATNERVIPGSIVDVEITVVGSTRPA